MPSLMPIAASLACAGGASSFSAGDFEEAEFETKQAEVQQETLVAANLDEVLPSFTFYKLKRNSQEKRLTSSLT